MQPLTTPTCTPYWLWKVYIIVAMEPQPTTSEQPTLKICKFLLWDPDPSPSSPSRTYALPVSPFGKLLPLYQVATLVHHLVHHRFPRLTSWKVMMDLGQDSREVLSFGMIVCWLLAVAL